MGRLTALLAAIVIVCSGGVVVVAAPTKVIRGEARVIDGDTIDIGGEPIRLEGIDAPEANQLCDLQGQDYSCGESSKKYLQDAVRDNVIECNIHGRDKYKRHLGTCTITYNDRNINSLMVKTGNAVAYLRHTSKYLQDEVDARVYSRGIWASKFAMPWTERHNSKGKGE